MLVLWISLIIYKRGYKTFNFGSYIAIDIIVMFLSVGIAIYALLFIFPSVNIIYTKATSIQMMKNKKIIK